MIMEGFIDLKIPCWQRHLLTRVLAIIRPSTALLSWFLFAVIVAANIWLMIQLFAE